MKNPNSARDAKYLSHEHADIIRTWLLKQIASQEKALRTLQLAYPEAPQFFGKNLEEYTCRVGFLRYLLYVLDTHKKMRSKRNGGSWIPKSADPGNSGQDSPLSGEDGGDKPGASSC